MKNIDNCMYVIETLLDTEPGYEYIQAREEYIEKLYPNTTTSEKESEKIFDAIEVLYDINNVTTLEDAIKCINKSLSISEYCLDAYNELSDTKETYDESIDTLLLGFKKGLEMFKFSEIVNDRGCLWGMTEYRPFARVLFKLAHELKKIGKRKYALTIYEFLHEFIDGDNLGIRDILLNEYLKSSTLPQARDLLDKYKDLNSVEFAYGEMIYCYLTKDLSSAEKYLKKGMELNKMIIDYIVYKKKLPIEKPSAYQLGTEEEAILYAMLFKTRWNRLPGLNEWVKNIIE